MFYALSFYVTKTVLVGPKWFWSDQIDLDPTIMIWSWPKWIGRDQNELVVTKTNWSWPKWIGQVQTMIFVLEIKTITESWDITTPSVGTILTYLAKSSLILVKFPSCCSKSKIEPYFLIIAQKNHAMNISCSNLKLNHRWNKGKKHRAYTNNILSIQIVLIFILLVRGTDIIHIFTKVCTIENGYEINIIFPF